MQNLLQQEGAQAQKSAKYVPLFLDRMFTGIYTQRSVLHSSADIITARFYGGRNDAIWMGSNIELSNNLTLKRRPGLSLLSTFNYPTPPLRSYGFQLTDGTIRLIVDTGGTNVLNITSVGNTFDGDAAIYQGTFPYGVSNGYAGYVFNIGGFTNPGNNGLFSCIGSTATSITVISTRAIAETATGTATSAGAVYWDQQNGSAVVLFGKTFGAGQTCFQGVAGTLYAGDGESTWKWTPLNGNNYPGLSVSVWNWGIVAPSQPSVTIVESGSASVSWVASTVWSTMGLIYDSGTNTVQQINSVNATGVNTTQLGTTGAGNPVWAGIGGATTDGSVTWTNRGPIGLWTANTVYQRGNVGGTASSPCIIYDPATKACYYNANSSNPGTSGNNYPKFKPGFAQITQDGGIRWAYLGVSGLPGTWAKSHVYPTFTGANADTSSISEPVSLVNGGLPTNQTVYWQVVTTGGTSSSSYTAPIWSTVAGQTTGGDGDLIWLSLGSDQWAANTPYFAWTASGSVFSAILDSNGNFQVCIQTGTSGSGSHPTWSTGYGVPTTDGSVIWTCVGSAMTWAASTQWFLPTTGFSPPSSSSPYGGASVIDSNGDVEFVTVSGKGGASPPSWSAIGHTTVDNAATWYNLEAHTTLSLAWINGYVYAYSLKARSLTDYYTVDVIGTSNPPVPPGLSNPLPFPTGSETGVISTASPVFTITGSNAGAVNTITGVGSLDPQVDTIVIWRSADGGGSSNMFELTEIPAPQPIGGVAQPWSFKDYLPDLPTNVYPGLDELIPAPIDDENDPPPVGFRPMAYNYQRIWGADGEMVPFSGGPDVITGNPNEAFNPSDELPFLAPVTRLVKTPQGIVTYLTDSIEMIAGGPLTSSFYSFTLAPGIGLLSFNALDVYAGEQYFFGSDNQLRMINPTLSVSLVGFPLGDQFANLPTSGISDANWNPGSVYVAVHQSGVDNCVIVSDGATGWYRLNPHQIPGAAQGPEPI